jgi:hypothetical protein
MTTETAAPEAKALDQIEAPDELKQMVDPASPRQAAILDQFTTIFETPVEPVARRRSVARAIGLHRVPAEAASIRRRLARKWRKYTRNA